MKVPFGYGECAIGFSGSTMPDGIWKSVKFLCDSSSWLIEKEVRDRAINIDNNIKNEVIGYHYDFGLKLIDTNYISASTQENIMNFLYYYKINSADDKWFYLYPTYSYGHGQQNLPVKLHQYNVILNSWSLQNIEDHKSRGQYLILNLTTKIMRAVDDVTDIMYRETTTGNWGSLNGGVQGYSDPQTGQVG